MKGIIAFAAVAGIASAASADLIAYWNQNGNANALAPDGFGYTAASFPMAADAGSGTWSLDSYNPAVDGNGIYTTVDSFSGTTSGALFGDAAGGSFSFIGDSNNGASVVLSFNGSLFEDITLDFARRGTSTGFNSVVVSYSTDGGSTLTAVGSLLGTAGSSFTLHNFDLSGLDGVANAQIWITFDGASSSNGNQRLDNVQINGTLVPAPGAFALLGMGGLLAARRRR